ncbi:hypothetical protein D3C78_1879850 [compost metagenome]
MASATAPASGSIKAAVAVFEATSEKVTTTRHTASKATTAGSEPRPCMAWPITLSSPLR